MELVEIYKDWRIYYGVIVAREEQEDGSWIEVIGYRADCNFRAATVSGRSLKAVKYAIDAWMIEYGYEEKTVQSGFGWLALLIGGILVLLFVFGRKK